VILYNNGGMKMKIYKNFETPEQAMAWASVKFIPNVNAIRSALARGEDYVAEVKNWDLEVVFTLTSNLKHLEQQGMLDSAKSWE
jgi:hypothetical protein